MDLPRTSQEKRYVRKKVVFFDPLFRPSYFALRTLLPTSQLLEIIYNLTP